MRKFPISLLTILTIVFLSCKTQKQNLILNAHGHQKTEESLDNFFVGLMDSLSIPGFSVAVINDAEIVYQKVFGLKIKGSDQVINKETFFEAASLSKPLFAFYVMSQVDKGILELDKPLYHY